MILSLLDCDDDDSGKQQVRLPSSYYSQSGLSICSFMLKPLILAVDMIVITLAIVSSFCHYILIKSSAVQMMMTVSKYKLSVPARLKRQDQSELQLSIYSDHVPLAQLVLLIMSLWAISFSSAILLFSIMTGQVQLQIRHDGDTSCLFRTLLLPTQITLLSFQ